jgi:hypothetical protein
MEDAWKVFNKIPSQDVVAWNAILVPYMGMVRKPLNILNRCLEKVYRQMISLFFVFCQLVAVLVWWMKPFAVVLQ